MKVIERHNLIKELKNIANLFKQMTQVAIDNHDIINTHILKGYGNIIYQTIAFLEAEEKYFLKEAVDKKAEEKHNER